MNDFVCSGYICHYFLSEDTRNNCVDLVKHFLLASAADESAKSIKKISVVNTGFFDNLISRGMVVHVFIAPFYFEDTDASRTALHSRLALTFCEMYNFGVYFDQSEFRSDYAGCYNELANENFQPLIDF